VERATVKTILLVVGSAIGGIVIFIVAVSAYFSYKFSGTNSPSEISFPSRTHPREVLVSASPPIKERFLGTQGVYSGGFSHDDPEKALAVGPGTIAGSATSDGKPVQGLRLRFALNGSVLSEWATTDVAGRYAVRVPYGKYRIDGYKLDYSVVDAVLGGKVDGPQNYYAYGSNVTVEVLEGQAGKGPDFAYVDPVIKKGPKGNISLSKPVVLEWEPYPGAGAYQVQLVEQKDARDFASQKRLIDWSKLPTTYGTSLSLSEHGIKLKSGYHYTVEIRALDARMRTLSTSAELRGGADFVVAD